MTNELLTACIISLHSCSPHVPAPPPIEHQQETVKEAAKGATQPPEGVPKWIWYFVAGGIIVSAAVSVVFIVDEVTEGPQN